MALKFKHLALQGFQKFIQAEFFGLRINHLATFQDSSLFSSGYTDVLLGLVRLGLLSAEQHPSVHPQARPLGPFLLNGEKGRRAIF
jgi:hypothetical protein